MKHRRKYTYVLCNMTAMFIDVIITTNRTVSNFEVGETMPETDTCTQFVEEDRFVYKLE